MSEFVISKNIFSRFDMYKFFLSETTRYNENGDKVCTYDEYYRLEKYFAKVFNCDCTDCGGVDAIIDYSKPLDPESGIESCTNTCIYPRDGVCDDPRGTKYCELGKFGSRI